jgi:hypothetical protein
MPSRPGSHLCVALMGRGGVSRSWNDHFFTLQTLAEEGGCLLIDSLGERLHVGCKRAHLLHFPGGAGEGLRACAAYLTAVMPAVALQSLADDVAADARVLKVGHGEREREGRGRQRQRKRERVRERVETETERQRQRASPWRCCSLPH